MKKLNKRGFTLVELLLVIAIIGILAAVLFVSLGSQRERARVTAFKEAVRSAVPAWTACTDGEDTVQGGDTSAGGDICSNAVHGTYQTISDCDGTGTVSITVNTATGYSWETEAVCNTSSSTCTATCTSSGCTFAGDGCD